MGRGRIVGVGEGDGVGPGVGVGVGAGVGVGVGTGVGRGLVLVCASANGLITRARAAMERVARRGRYFMLVLYLDKRLLHPMR